MDIEVVETTVEKICPVHWNIPEFRDGSPQYAEDFLERIRGKKHYILVGGINETGVKGCVPPAGYLVAYERDSDGSIYCWMAGVVPRYRRAGILSQLMEKLFVLAREDGYTSVKIKTRNHRREMLAFLVSKGFYVTVVFPEEKVRDHRIEFIRFV